MRKVCKECGFNKSIKNYHNHPNMKDGTLNTCKDCYRSKRRTTKYHGFIYIITNPAWKEYVKIGKSIRLKDRLDSYQTGTPHRDYEIYYSEYVTDTFLVERELKKLKSLTKGEWYKLTPMEAQKEIEILIKKHDL